MPGINKDTLAKGPLATEHFPRPRPAWPPLLLSLGGDRAQGTGVSHPACILLTSPHWKGSLHPWIQLRTKGPSSASPSLTPCSRVLVPRVAVGGIAGPEFISPMLPQSLAMCLDVGSWNRIHLVL